MDAKEFLEAVWPAEGNGFYCIVALPSNRHLVYETIDEVVENAMLMRSSQDVYFTVHTLNRSQRIDENGKKHWREHANMKLAKTFFADLDVGADKPYRDRVEARAALNNFLDATGFPAPIVVNSGYGVHLYWPLTDAIPSDEWRPYASQLHQIFKHHGLHADPTRVFDQSSILRVPDTYNHKQAPTLAPVEVDEEAPPTATRDLITLINRLYIQTGAAAPIQPSKSPPVRGNLASPIEYDGPIPTVGAIRKVCPLFKELVKPQNAPSVSQGEWYHNILQLIRLAHKGPEFAHAISALDPRRYDPDTTDEKLAILEQKEVLPTSCVKMAEEAAPSRQAICPACPHVAAGKGPWTLALASPEAAPAPQRVTNLPDGTIDVQEIVEPPLGYTRAAGGGIFWSAENKHGVVVPQKFYDHDMYPVDIVTDSHSQKFVIWHASLPLRADVEFGVPLRSLVRYTDINNYLADAGIIVHPDHHERMVRYMSAYTTKLQKAIADSVQRDHFGWVEDHKGFVFKDEVLYADKVKPANLNKDAKIVGSFIGKKGTLADQVALMEFYNYDEFIPAQFMILASLASVIFGMTGEHGVIVNASGISGSSKSTSLFYAASMWGYPDKYPLNGNKGNSSQNGRNSWTYTLANLPPMIDEVTAMMGEEIQTFALNISAASTNQIKQNRDGTLRDMPKVELDKSSIMMTTANTSLHQVLSNKNASGTAGSMRVFEIIFHPQTLYEPIDALEWLLALKQNFGHIGPEFVRYVLANYEMVERRVLAKLAEISRAVAQVQAERFWIAAAASAIVAGEIAIELALLPYDIHKIERWLIDKQIPSLRGIVSHNYTTPLDMLMNYVASVAPRIIVVNHGTKRQADIVRDVNQSIEGRFERDTGFLYLSAAALKSSCMRNHQNFGALVEELRAQGIIVGRVIKDLTGGITTHPPTKIMTYRIDTRCKAMGGYPVITTLSDDEKVVPFRGFKKASPEPPVITAEDFIDEGEA